MQHIDNFNVGITNAVIDMMLFSRHAVVALFNLVALAAGEGELDQGKGLDGESVMDRLIG